MKKSKYCFEIRDKNRTIILHLLSFNIIILNDNDKLMWDKELFDKISPLKQSYLEECGMLLREGKTDGYILEQALKYFSRRKKDVPSHTIFITNECNMKCPYCFEKNVSTPSMTMDEKMLESAFFTIKNSNGDKTLKKILIFGGEPFLKKNLNLMRSLFLLLRTLKFKYVEVVTNGIELPYFLQLLVEFKDVVNSIRLTLNGCKEIHNKIRDTCGIENSYDMIISSVNLLLRMTETKINLNVLLEKDNVDSISAMLNDLNQYGILNNRRVTIGFGRTQFATSPDKINYINEIPLEDYYKTIVDLYSKNELVHIDMLQGGETPILCELVRRIMSNEKEEMIPDLTTCRATYPGRYCYYPDGNIYPCTEVAGMEEYAIGTFYPIEQRNSSWKDWQGYKFPQKCIDCKYIAVCSGGCPVSNLCRNGKIDEIYCYNVKETVERTLLELFQEGYINENIVY